MKNKELDLKREEWVEIGFAKIPGEEKLISLKKADKHKAYECPQCGGKMFKRGGQSRRDHFYHKDSSGCKITYEKNLHKCSKIYLFEKLDAIEDFSISVPLKFLPDGSLKSTLKKAEASGINLPISSFFQNVMASHTVEKKVGKYRPDVLSEQNGKPLMLWEIFVTSEIKDDKASFLASNKLPFIELEPSEFGREDFAFALKAYGNFELFRVKDMPKIDFEEASLDELKDWLNTSGLKIFFENHEPIVRNKIFRDLDQLHQFGIPVMGDLCENLSPVSVFRDYISKNGRIEIKQTFNKKVDSEVAPRIEELKDVDLDEEKGYPILLLNGKVPDSPLNLTGEFFRQLSTRHTIMVRINDENEMVWFEMKYMNKDFEPDTICMDNYTETMPFVWVNLQFVDFGKDENGYPCYKITNPEIDEGPAPDLPESILVSPVTSCYRFLLRLQKKVKIHLILHKGIKDKRKEFVTGFIIDGLYSEKEFDYRITDALFEKIRRILFFNSCCMIEAEEE